MQKCPREFTSRGHSVLKQPLFLHHNINYRCVGVVHADIGDTAEVVDQDRDLVAVDYAAVDYAKANMQS